MGPRAIYFETYGCQMNVYDAETMRAALEADGHATVSDEEDADTVVVTTCAVRASAEERVWGKLGALRRWKAAAAGRLIVVAGCMAEKSGAAILARAPQVDVLVGTASFGNVAELLARRERERRTVAVLGVPRERLPAGFSKAPAPSGAAPASGFASWLDRPAGGLHAFVKVMEGCDHFCTYCIVPLTRGKERSRPPEEIEREVSRHVDRGVREVTLLGQNVNSYGKGLRPAIRFPELLARLDGLAGLRRIRFTTSHPQDCGDDLIAAIRDLPAVCEHLHLPFQSGSDRILARMNRRYSAESFLDRVARARRTVPGLSVTTDVIVGFPGETEEEFEATVRVLDRAQFEGAYLFRFSPREGTPAAEMEGAVPEETASRRLASLIRMQNRITLRASLRRVGQEEVVLVEGPSERNPGRLHGRTRGYRVAILPGPQDWVGSEVPVRVTAASTWTLHAEALTSAAA